ncbi:MAG: hypothetical protein HYT73_04990 [Candidatus Aenigmarchaeota archaeon]|nr:hypothetical protein [Candidatus Aenigmarchaeota archaeon]
MAQQVSGKENSIVIYADTREMDTKVAAILSRRCELREKQLDVADYLLSDGVACERKTCDDFLQSIVDGRLFSQMSVMKDSFESPFVMIEGDTLFGKREMHDNAIRGALASVAVDYRMPILWTENQLETAEMLLAVARREQTDNGRSVSIRGKRRMRSMNEQQEFLLAGLPLINSKKAKALLKHFGTPQGVFTAEEGDLRKAEGIGEELSRKIRKILTSRYEKSILED